MLQVINPNSTKPKRRFPKELEIRMEWVWSRGDMAGSRGPKKVFRIWSPPVLPLPGGHALREGDLSPTDDSSSPGIPSTRV
jgi:hypothetical protein